MEVIMKKLFFVIIAGALLVSGCNASEIDNKSSSVSSSSSANSSSKQIALSTSENTALTSDSKPESMIITTSTVKIPESSSVISSNNIPESPSNKEENTLSITITVNERTFSATLYDNETAKAFKERLPIVLDMSELNGNEKYYYLPDSLPRDSSCPSKINNGDIMLYGSDCLVIFYESFSTSYSYTPIGKIDDPDGLAAALGSGSVQVTFNAVPNH